MPDDKDPLFVRQLEEQLAACVSPAHRAVLLESVLTTAISMLADEKGRQRARLAVRKLDDYLNDIRFHPDWPE